VQSSSVMMALTLSAVYAGVLKFTMAAALILGSETGTTIKLLLGAAGGNAAKKRVAWGNFFFNIVLTVFSFVFLHPIISLITIQMGILNPLIGLVTFQTMVNIFAILLFLPFLDLFVQILEKLFTDQDAANVTFIENANIAEPETALDLFRKEADFFIHDCMIYNLSSFEINTDEFKGHSTYELINKRKHYYQKTQEEKYDFLKQWQGEIQSFYMSFRGKISEEQEGVLNQLISAVRSSMYAVKGIKDISTNTLNLRQSSKDIKYDFFRHHQKHTASLYFHLYRYITSQEKADFAKLKQLFDEVETDYMAALNEFYLEARQVPIENMDITIILNFNRELFTSNKAMLIAVKDLLLPELEAEAFNEVPVYRT